MRLIDADALKEEVNKKNIVGRFNTLLLIDNAPTVEPTFGLFKELLCTDCEKRPQGEYINGTQGYYCSLCYEIDYAYYDHKFCPYCGADMRGKEE